MDLEEIEATIVSNRAIARVHRTFFNDPAPTDVITFPDGEILIGAGVVAGNAARFGNTPKRGSCSLPYPWTPAFGRLG